MTRLLAVELRRFFWRRSFRLFAALVVAGIAVAAVLVFVNSDPTPQGARARYEEAVASCTNSFRDSQELPPRYENVEEFCEEQVPPEEFFDRTFRLTDLADIFMGTSVPLIILGLAFGASFIGAEWHHGTITTMLTWEPRRVRVMVGKVIAAMVSVFVFVVAMQSVLGLALWPVAAAVGSTAGADVAWLADTALVVARGAVIAGLAAAMGFAVASMARNTTTALIVGFVYFAVGEAVLRALRPGWQRWLIGDNAGAFVTADPASIFGRPYSVLSAFLIVAAYALGLTAAATGLFRARDVT